MLQNESPIKSPNKARRRSVYWLRGSGLSQKHRQQPQKSISFTQYYHKKNYNQQLIGFFVVVSVKSR